MKLLFDQNLSPRLVHLLSDLFPGSSHVSFLGLDTADDEAIWAFAREHQFVIVSKDADYSDLGLLRSFPPYVIWLRMGNCTTAQIESALRVHFTAILRFEQDADLGTLIIL
jgi:predicted nuclease of predicted toxin-antitoxin system